MYGAGPQRILKVLIAAATLVVTMGPAAGAKLWNEGMADDWELVFADEFSGTALDTTKWVTCYWWAIDGCAIGTNGERQWYLPDNVGVDDGELRLTARLEQTTTPDGELRPYTSGMVSTGRAGSDLEEEPRFAFTYGRAEVRARLPFGQGLWPAFWLLPIDHESRPEIDVMEVLGHDTATLRMHYHYTDDGDRSSLGRNVTTTDLAVGWHTYAVEWGPDAIIWYLDGHERWRIEDRTIIPDEPMYLIVNLAVGGEFPGEPDAATPFPSVYGVDHVRVWQRVQ